MYLLKITCMMPAARTKTPQVASRKIQIIDEPRSPSDTSMSTGPSTATRNHAEERKRHQREAARIRLYKSLAKQNLRMGRVQGVLTPTLTKRLQTLSQGARCVVKAVRNSSLSRQQFHARASAMESQMLAMTTGLRWRSRAVFTADFS